MKNKKTVWLPAFRNVIPANYENWLEELALQGWNVDHVGQWNSIAMTFHRSEPKKYRYIYDLQPFLKEDYMSTYEQFGWEFVGKMASCFLWRKEYTDKRPQSFTSRESLEKRNKQVVLAISISFIICIIMSVVLGLSCIINIQNLSASSTIQLAFGTVFSFAFALYLCYVMRKIYKNRFR